MDDLISRQAAIKLAIDLDCESRGIIKESKCREIENRYNMIPAAQPQRMRGRWLELTNTNHTYICSICGRMLVNVTDGKNTVTKNYPFCHCGADMRGGEQDE